jgi:hypothetical protein
MTSARCGAVLCVSCVRVCHHQLLHTMYELDLLEEDVVVAWHGSRCGEESVKTAVQPIIDWLQEASEEESDEEEGDD